MRCATLTFQFNFHFFNDNKIMTSTRVTFKLEQKTAYITLNRPDKHNGLDKPMIVDLVKIAKKNQQKSVYSLCYFTGCRRFILCGFRF